MVKPYIKGADRYVFMYIHLKTQVDIYVTGPAKTRHICTNYTCLENGTFLGHCL